MTSQFRGIRASLYSGVSTAILCVGLAWSVSVNAHVISEEDHHAFEHKYADMCVAKEKKARAQQWGNAQKDADDPATRKLCDCIALEESKRLTIGEVKKFLRENKYPMSLMIKAGQAEQVCAQKM